MKFLTRDLADELCFDFRQSVHGSTDTHATPLLIQDVSYVKAWERGHLVERLMKYQQNVNSIQYTHTKKKLLQKFKEA